MIRAMLSVSLEVVITQALVKKADGTGRMAVHEILLGTPAIRNLIREGKIPQIYSMMQTGSKIGMQTMKDAIYELLDEGLITQDTARTILATGQGDNLDDRKSGEGGAARHTAHISRVNEGF